MRSLVIAFILILALNAGLAADAKSGINPTSGLWHNNNSQFGPNGLNPDDNFMRAQQAVKPAPRDTSNIQYTGSSALTPGGVPAQSQGQQFDDSANPTYDVALGGTADKSASIGLKGSVIPMTQYKNLDYKKDGQVPLPGAIPTPPLNVSYKPNTPAGVAVMAALAGVFKSIPGEDTGLADGLGELTVSKKMQQFETEAGSTMQKTEAAMSGIAEKASEAMADGFNPTWWQMLRLSATPLVNVANPASGAACSTAQPVRSYSNAIYIVQQSYYHIYLPIAFLLLLPGAVATQVKSLIQFGVLNNSNDDDAVSPFSGILKALVAVFLIPASQVIVSYSIDVGNSMQYEVSKHIGYANLFLYADEQVFRAPAESFLGELLPPEAIKSLGKLQGTSEKLAVPMNMSKGSVMLQALANSLCQGVAFGLVILACFQTVMACYLMLMGPVAAAFYAWPSGAGGLFSRVFAGWVDGLVNLALWRFWWCVVLLVMDTRLSWLSGTSLFNICSTWELIMFISFLVMLSYVPFNPFDFRPGEMVQRIMDKSDEAVQEASNKK